ncbi:tetratricopeptide repeat protein [Nocardiopsis alba]|uniref:tetratricopeptide repeat protein n=1 Tax=Nocardiopsis alba TaxID=53437 RepID=UPI00366B90A3
MSPDTIGAWLRGERCPQSVEPLLGVMEQIRAEAAHRGLLEAPVDHTGGRTIGELLAPGRWRQSWKAEQERRTRGNQAAADSQRAMVALEEDERRNRRAALADHPRPVRWWTPQRLGVHAAIPGRTVRPQGAVGEPPHYVPRPHDTSLREKMGAAIEDGARPQMLVIRGGSCTGKTRTAYEALTATVPDDFDLLFPADADGLLAALEADAVGPRTVLWLNEAQEYLDGPSGETVAAALLRRLDAEGPLIVIATLWPDHHQTLTRRSGQGADDQHGNARELLVQAHYTNVPKTFAEQLDAVREAARHDPSLAEALETGGADLTQVLAAGPDLVDHYEHPAGEHGVYGRALISAAMDAYRLGVANPLPLGFLEEAAPGYLTDTERADAAPDWFIGALAYARSLIKDTARPLQDVPRPTGMGAQPGVVRLTDFLQQHGRRTRITQCPPAAFWEAARTRMSDPTDLVRLARAAEMRSRYHHSAQLYCAAVDAGYTVALADLAWLREMAGDREGAERLLERAVDAGDPDTLADLARLREMAGDREGAERLLEQAAGAGDTLALERLARSREMAGDREGAERLLEQAAGAGDTLALVALARSRERAGDREGAERLLEQAIAAGHSFALADLAWLRERAGDGEGAERFALQTVNAGYSFSLKQLARLREKSLEMCRRYGLAADGTLSEPWEWPEPRAR